MCHLATAGTRIPYLKNTSESSGTEGAREDGHFRGRSKPIMKYAGLELAVKLYYSYIEAARDYLRPDISGTVVDKKHEDGRATG